MDLSFSKKLREVPDLSEAKNLQTLDLSYSESIVSLSSSIGELKKLKDLTMFGCTKLEAVPTNLDLASFESLYMDGCSRLKSFPELSRNIQFLYLGETAIEEFLSSITCWTRLIEFNISGIKGSKHSLMFQKLSVSCLLATTTSRISQPVASSACLSYAVLT